MGRFAKVSQRSVPDLGMYDTTHYSSNLRPEVQVPVCRDHVGYHSGLGDVPGGRAAVNAGVQQFSRHRGQITPGGD